MCDCIVEFEHTPHLVLGIVLFINLGFLKASPSHLVPFC